MNKSDFIKELQRQSQLSAEQCAVVNDVFENHFVFRKKNKTKVVAELSVQLNVDEEEANSIFEQAMSILKSELKHVVRRPFGSKH